MVALDKKVPDFAAPATGGTFKLSAQRGHPGGQSGLDAAPAAACGSTAQVATVSPKAPRRARSPDPSETGSAGGPIQIRTGGRLRSWR